ncbi:hypothetical protein, partial [Micromonospora chersina]|uniref:hypothetical protein n=1 Tax=Micromonospora chersina TaxID=47854 RepID=UPI003722B8FE
AVAAIPAAVRTVLRSMVLVRMVINAFRSGVQQHAQGDAMPPQKRGGKVCGVPGDQGVTCSGGPGM